MPREYEHPTQDFMLRCAITACKKKLGMMTLTYIGVPHHGYPAMYCMECIEKEREQLESGEHVNMGAERARLVLAFLDEED